MCLRQTTISSLSARTNGVQVSWGFTLYMIDFQCLRMSTCLSLQQGLFVVLPSHRFSRGKAHTVALVAAVSDILPHPHPVPTFGLKQRGLPAYPVLPCNSDSTRVYQVTAEVSGWSCFGLPGEAFEEVRAPGCSSVEVGEDMAGPGQSL